MLMSAVEFVNTQLNRAPTFTFAAGIVSVVPARLPIDPVLPVTALLASVQLAEVSVKPEATVSDKVTAAPTVVTLIALGLAGVAVPLDAVVMGAGALARFVRENENGPPDPMLVIF